MAEYFLNDEATGVDSLSRGLFARAFAQIANTSDTPMVVGLYGGWGVGKTSLLELVKKQLDPEENILVWFNPWQHQFDDNPALAMMHALVDKANLGAEGKKLLGVLSLAFGSMLLKASTTLSVKELKEYGEMLEDEKFQVRENRVLMRKHFEELIKKARGRKEKRIVFFIDDLDRCMPKQTLALLEALKLFMNFKGCVYFLAVDRSALELSIKHEYGELEIDGTSYLDKIVQLPFHIPAIAQDNMRGFVEPLLSEELTPCLDILVTGLGDNPRKIKRFVNTLTLNHLLANKCIKEKYDVRILALLLMVQYRSPSLYRQIERDHGFLIKLNNKDENAVKLFDEHLGTDERIKKVIDIVEIPDDTPFKAYIYLTEIAGIGDAQSKVSDMKRIQKEHNEWLNSGGEEGKRFDLSGANLRNIDLNGRNLREADLGGADLSGANLSVARLIAADLSGANLNGANLSGANLNGADLSGANLSGADLKGADLRGADLGGANLRGADLIRAKLNGANLSRANLREAGLRVANLSGANLEGANLERADLEGADLRGINGLISDQLVIARTLYVAMLEPELEKEVREREPKIFNNPLTED